MLDLLLLLTNKKTCFVINIYKSSRIDIDKISLQMDFIWQFHQDSDSPRGIYCLGLDVFMGPRFRYQQTGTLAAKKCHAWLFAIIRIVIGTVIGCVIGDIVEVHDEEDDDHDADNDAYDDPRHIDPQTDAAHLAGLLHVIVISGRAG